jgi:hypothetical protein
MRIRIEIFLLMGIWIRFVSNINADPPVSGTLVATKNERLNLEATPLRQPEC